MEGAEITKVREAAGLRQPEFAKRLGIHPVTLSRFENDRDPIPLYIELAVPELERRLVAEKESPKAAKKPKKQ